MTARQDELECARRLVAVRRQQRQSEWRAKRERERVHWLQQTGDTDANRQQAPAPRASQLHAQELALVRAVTRRQGFINAQLASSHELSPLARWYHQLQLLQLHASAQSTSESSSGGDSDQATAQVDALAALEQTLVRDVQCMDLVYATGTSAQDAAVTLLERDGNALSVDELLSFASMRDGVVTRVTCAKQHSAQYAFSSSLFVRDLTERASELLLRDASDAKEFIELVWSDESF